MAKDLAYALDYIDARLELNEDVRGLHLCLATAVESLEGQKGSGIINLLFPITYSRLLLIQQIYYHLRSFEVARGHVAAQAIVRGSGPGMTGVP